MLTIALGLSEKKVARTPRGVRTVHSSHRSRIPAFLSLTSASHTLLTIAATMEGGTHSDTDSEYIAHSPSPALPPNRYVVNSLGHESRLTKVINRSPPGDIYEHVDFADGSPEASDDDDSDDASSQFCDCQPIPERVGDFVVLAKHRLDATGTHMHVVKWRSEKTGLSVIWADTPVSPYFLLLGPRRVCI